ncbi:MAG: cytochrome c [Alphaproteobacteria bacterium]|nr:cytochrome c [Alphaproteobacteria bacterium]
MIASRLLGVLLAGSLCSLAGASLVLAQDDDPVAVGRSMVEMNCAGCHATGPSGDSPLAQAPHFRDLHLRYDVQDLSEALVEGIVTAHPDMPQFAFDPDQAAAIVAYLETLEPALPEGGPLRPGRVGPSPSPVVR